MKNKLIGFISAFLVLVSVLTFSVSAEKIDSHNLEFTPPSEFIVLTEENAAKNTAAIESLGFTESSFVGYLKNNNILLFASRADKRCQLTVSVGQTSFSKNVENLAYLENENIKEMLPQLIGDSTALRIETINDSKFVLSQISGSDNAGEFTSLQYITIKNEKLYTITISFSETELSSESVALANALINSLNIAENSNGITMQGFQNVAIYIGLVVIILFLAAVIVYIIYTVVTDVISNRNTSDVAPYIKIKRRRFK